jgi:SAM-dependent methyltransferase
MVTDNNSSYLSPAGKEFSFAAARFAGVNPSSRVLDIGCGYGECACNLASEFRCRVTACDNIPENIRKAQDVAVDRGVSHLITFETIDILDADYSEEPFELLLAEGGVLSYISRSRGLKLAGKWLVDRGWIGFSDLIIIAQNVPEEILKIYDDETYHYETEHTYRELITAADMEVHFMSLVPPSGWDNYYSHMARRLDDRNGLFSEKRIKFAFHREIDVFYRLEAYKYIGYLFCIARKKK